MMHKTTLVVNDKKIARVRKLLGTKGIRDTVERALDEVIAVHQRAGAVERLIKGLDYERLRKVRDEAWK